MILNTYDLTMAAFELVAAVLKMADVRSLLRDKKLAGVNWYATAFYVLWGVWNIALYPHLHFWFSFLAGLLITGVNLWWLYLAIKYGRKVPPVQEGPDCLCGVKMEPCGCGEGCSSYICLNPQCKE